MKRRILALLAALLCSTTVAKADFAFTVGSGQTGFSFTASTGGTALCAATVTHCFASVPINTAGAAFFTSGNPGLVTLTGTNNIATVTTVTGVTTVSTVTTLSTLTGGGAASGAADSGNPVKVGGKYNSSPVTLTDGNRGDLQLDVNGYAKVNVTNANANGQATMANSSPVVIASNQSAVPVTLTSTTLTGTSSVNTAQVNGVTVLTGTGATGTGAQRVTVSTDQATNAGAALVKGGVGVVNGGSRYQHVAASQTAAVLQSSSGATGDYLSHCVIYPSTTAAGNVTVYDNTNSAANNVIEFVTGTLSNLAPIAIPVGAISRNGAWKVDTGANETVVCYGSFS